MPELKKEGFRMTRWALAAVLVGLALGVFVIGEGSTVAWADTWEVECQLTQAQYTLGDQGTADLIYAWDPQWVGTPGSPGAYITPTLPEYLAWYGFVC